MGSVDSVRLWNYEGVRVYGGHTLAVGVLLGAVALSDVAWPAEPSTDVPHAAAPSAGLADKPASGSAPRAMVQVSAATGKASLFRIGVDIDRDKVDMEAIKRRLRAGQQPAVPRLLSADVAGAPLRKVLLELGRKLDAKVYMVENMAEEPITAEFKRLPVEDGIKKILEGCNYLVVRAKPPAPQASEDTGEAQIAEIRVLGKKAPRQEPVAAGELKELQPDPAEERRDLEDLRERAREALIPKDRMKAMELYLDKADGVDEAGRNDVLMAGAKDSDPKVQKRALGLMSDLTEIPPTVEPITELVFKSNRPDVRSAALSALVTTRGVDAAPILEQVATEDASAAVRKAAEHGLKRIERVQAILKRQEELRRQQGRQ